MQFDNLAQLVTLDFCGSEVTTGPNPMTSINNASVVNFYNAMSSPARFES
jgi:hypothetical protein